MRVVRNLSELSPSGPSVVTLGNFDGVHLGHQQLLGRTVETARKVCAAAVAVTFEPHPTKVLAPASDLKLLTPLEVKIRLIEAQKIDCLVILPFTDDLSRLSPAEFVHSLLTQRLRAVAAAVGPDFRFGHRRTGDVQKLEEFARREGFRLEVLPSVEARGERVSSSHIRELVAAGRVALAGRLLGRPFAVSGSIVRGLGVGKTQTVPTLNLAPYDELLPQRGVYVTRTRLGERVYESVTNVGHKPTFGEHRLTVESFLLKTPPDKPEAEMEIEFLHRLRNEVKFPDHAALKTQIQKDARRAAGFFRRLERLRRPAPSHAQG